MVPGPQFYAIQTPVRQPTLPRALKISEQVAREHPDSAVCQSDAGGSWHGLGSALQHRGRSAEARAAFRRAVRDQQAAWRKTRTKFATADLWFILTARSSTSTWSLFLVRLLVSGV